MTVVLKEGTANLYIEARAVCKGEEALVVIEDEHTNITRIEKNGRVLYLKEKTKTETSEVPDKEAADKSQLNLEDIITFADEVRLEGREKYIGASDKVQHEDCRRRRLKNPWIAAAPTYIITPRSFSH